MLYVIYEFYLDELYALTADGYPMTVRNDASVSRRLGTLGVMNDQ